MPEWYENDLDLDAALNSLGAPAAATPIVDAETILDKATSLSPAAGSISTGLSGWKLFAALSVAGFLGYLGGISGLDSGSETSNPETIQPPSSKEMAHDGGSAAAEESEEDKKEGDAEPQPETTAPSPLNPLEAPTEESKQLDRNMKQTSPRPMRRTRGPQRPIAILNKPPKVSTKSLAVIDHDQPSTEPIPSSEMTALKLAGASMSDLSHSALSARFDRDNSPNAIRLNPMAESGYKLAHALLKAEETRAAKSTASDTFQLPSQPLVESPFGLKFSAGLSKPHSRQLPLALNLGGTLNWTRGDTVLKTADARMQLSVLPKKDGKWALLPSLEVGAGGGLVMGPVDMTITATTGLRSAMVKKENNGDDEMIQSFGPYWTVGGRLQADVTKRWYAAVHYQAAPLVKGEHLEWIGAEVGMRFRTGS